MVKPLGQPLPSAEAAVGANTIVAAGMYYFCNRAVHEYANPNAVADFYVDAVGCLALTVIEAWVMHQTIAYCSE